jgi:glycosyltransferase involved in cell wall biosynthesis
VDTGRELRGGQRQLLMLARGLRADGHEQIIITPEGSALEDRAREEGFDVFSLPRRDPGNLHGMVALRQKLLSEPWEILHAHDGRGQTISWLASAGLLARRVAHRRVTFQPARRSRQRFIYGHTCHAVIAISEFIKRLLVECGVPDWRVEVIPDGVDLPAELPAPDLRQRVRAAWGFGEQDFVAGHVGAWTSEKGQDLLLEALNIARAQVREMRIVFAGDGPERSDRALRRKLESAGDAARLVGRVENLEEFFPGLDLFVMPSRAEGLGSSALLAMAYGLPVLATRAGGLPEVVEDGRTGWLVEPESAAALAAGLLTAAAERARLRDFGAAARARARLFSGDIMRQRTEALYRRLLR